MNTYPAQLGASASGQPADERPQPDVACLLEVVYPELRRFARMLMLRERPNHTLQPTAVVHEAVLKLFGLHSLKIENAEHFYALMVGEMRRILTSYARRKLAQKRNGVVCTSDEEILPARSINLEDIILVDQILERLAVEDVRAYRTVSLRFFGGLSVEETAAVLGVSEKTVKRDWLFAKPWLYGELSRR